MCLPGKHKDLSCIPRTQVVHICNPNTGEAGKGGFQGSLDSQPIMLGEFQARERLSHKLRQIVPKEGHQKHVSTCMHACTSMPAHLHTYEQHQIKSKYKALHVNAEAPQSRLPYHLPASDNSCRASMESHQLNFIFSDNLIKIPLFSCYFLC